MSVLPPYFSFSLCSSPFLSSTEVGRSGQFGLTKVGVGNPISKIFLGLSCLDLRPLYFLPISFSFSFSPFVFAPLFFCGDRRWTRVPRVREWTAWMDRAEPRKIFGLFPSPHRLDMGGEGRDHREVKQTLVGREKFLESAPTSQGCSERTDWNSQNLVLVCNQVAMGLVAEEFREKFLRSGLVKMWFEVGRK